MVEKGPASGGHSMPCTLRLINSTNLVSRSRIGAQRRLRRVQPFLSRDRQAAFLGDRYENSEGAVAP